MSDETDRWAAGQAELRRTLEALKAVWETRRMQDASRPPTPEEIQRDISRTMADVVGRDSGHNPSQLNPPQTVRVANAPEVKSFGEGRGFVEPKALPIHSAKGSSEEALIDAMVRKFVGGPNEPPVK